MAPDDYTLADLSVLLLPLNGGMTSGELLPAVLLSVGTGDSTSEPLSLLLKSRFVTNDGNTALVCIWLMIRLSPPMRGLA